MAEAARPDYGCNGFGDVENYLNECHGQEEGFVSR